MDYQAISFDLSNGEKRVFRQERHDGTVTAVLMDEKWAPGSQTDGGHDPVLIPPGDVIMLLNYYRYMKDNDYQCDFINPHGKRDSHCDGTSLLLAYSEDGEWAGGYLGHSLKPLFGGPSNKVGEYIKTAQDISGVRNVTIVTKEQLEERMSALQEDIRKSYGKSFPYGVPEVLDGWFMTDDDSYQHCKRIDKDQFQLIEMGMSNPDTNLYTVYTGTVDVSQFMAEQPKELNEILRTYTYRDSDHVKSVYGKFSMQIFAECIFEYYNVNHAEIVFHGTEQECIDYILQYADNGEDD